MSARRADGRKAFSVQDWLRDMEKLDPDFGKARNGKPEECFAVNFEVRLAEVLGMGADRAAAVVRGVDDWGRPVRVVPLGRTCREVMVPTGGATVTLPFAGDSVPLGRLLHFMAEVTAGILASRRERDRLGIDPPPGGFGRFRVDRLVWFQGDEWWYLRAVDEDGEPPPAGRAGRSGGRERRPKTEARMRSGRTVSSEEPSAQRSALSKRRAAKFRRARSPGRKKTPVAGTVPLSVRMQRIWQAIVDKHRSGGRDALTGPEQVWWDVWTFVHMTSNGGLKHYLEVTAGEDIDWLIASLKKIGAADLQRGVVHLRNRFPGGRPSSKPGMRRRQLRGLNEDEIPWPAGVAIDGDVVERLVWEYWQAGAGSP